MAKKINATPEIEEQIDNSALDELMGDRFDIYAKDVIQDRAIPDARDGLKPVQRRIIYAMYKTGNTIDKPTKKCAHIVGEVMGKYHPHGDSSIYEALVRMSQTWKIRLPLIDFQGNNGSMDGDGPAAYRYTEARLSALSKELVRDIDKNTVDMGLTFDDYDFEPTVLPSRFPNLLVNGTSGIAVGMATEIAPHNLKELIGAIIHKIEYPNCDIESLMKYIPGPDFPTGGIIYQSQGLRDIYLTGRGKIDIVSRTSIEESKGLKQIIISEIPYGIVKSDLVKAIDKLRFDKVLPGIDEVRDETDKTGIRIAIDLKKEANEEAILSYLFSKTALRSSFSMNMVAIVNGRPQTLNLETYCETYIAHQVDVLRRRSKFNLDKDKARLDIVLGLIKVSSIIDQVIATIRHSNDKADVERNLVDELGFTKAQAEAIAIMPLYKLSHTDIVALENERDALISDIAYLEELLSNEDSLNKLLISDLRTIAKTYGDDRRTEIKEQAFEAKSIDARDLIAKEEVMIAVSKDGYVKRSSIASYKGSGGHNGILPGLKDGDTLVYCGPALTTDHLVMFTSKGNYLYVPVHILKNNKWLDEGMHVNYAISLDSDDKIIKAFVIKKFRDDLYIVIVSRKCMIKRIKVSSLPVTRFNRPVRAMRLLSNDEVVGVVQTSGNSNVLVFADNGLATLYNENLISVTGTSSGGVKAGSFKGGEVASIQAFRKDDNNKKLILVTDVGHIRIFSTSNINESERLSKATILFKTFKNDPNKLVFTYKIEDRDGTYKFLATLSNGERKEFTVPDLYLTPMDKYAKSGDISLPKKVKIAAINLADNCVIDNNTLAEAPEIVVDINEEELETINEENTQTFEDDNEIKDIMPSDEEIGTERFEQISIFGDDDF